MKRKTDKFVAFEGTSSPEKSKSNVQEASASIVKLFKRIESRRKFAL